MVQQLKPPFVQNPNPKKILVIGGGIAGLAALRALVEEGGVEGTQANSAPFERVELIERRDDVGGVWYLDDKCVELEKSYEKGTANDIWPIVPPSSSSKKPYWPSPAYPALRGNVLPKFLSLSGTQPFPPPQSSEEALIEAGKQIQEGKVAADPFPTLAETYTYLQRIAKPLKSHIRCNTECIGVWELPHPEDASKNVWAVRTRDWQKGGQEITEYWDAIIVTVGWTDKPLYPKIDGMSEARKAGFIEHCKWYRGPEPYGEQERIVVVGNGNSGNDVCAQLAARRTLGKHEPVIRICRHKAWFFYVSLPDPLIRDVPAIQKLVVREEDGKSKLDLHLIDGEVVKDVDRVILAAGYEIGKFPFVNILDRELTQQEAQELPNLREGEPDDQWLPNKESESPWRSISDAPKGTSFDEDGNNPPRVSGLFWHFLHERASTLAIVNLTVTSIPFWTSDFQGHLLRAIWDGSYKLPPIIEGRREYENGRIALIRKLHQEKAENERKALEVWEKRKEQLAQEKEGNKFEAPDHIYLLPYHVLGTMVGDYLPFLRQMAIEAKPQWAQKLPIFEESHDLHFGMYDRKRESLLAKRAIIQAQEASEQGLQQNIHANGTNGVTLSRRKLDVTI
jgi:Flavin-binding monooxygenase-like